MRCYQTSIAGGVLSSQSVRRTELLWFTLSCRYLPIHARGLNLHSNLAFVQALSIISFTQDTHKFHRSIQLYNGAPSHASLRLPIIAKTYP